MLERLCPQCGAANAITRTQCAACGTSIEQPLQQRARAGLSLRSVRLPAHWQQTGRVVALGLLTVAAEAGYQWLQRRQSSPASQPPPAGGRVVALQQRIIEHWDRGQLRERTIERTVWLDREQSKR